MATELAKAYVQIIPSAKGIEGSISSVMNGEADSAGKNSGEGFSKNFGSTVKKAIVGLGLGKVIMDGLSGASEFETAMAKTSTLFSGTGEQFAALQNQILNLSSTFGMSANTLAEAAYSAESAGVSMENLGPMLEGSAKLAAAGFTDIDTALSATAKTMNAYGDKAGTIDEIQKILIQTQNLGITTVGELGASLANVTPTAAAAGVGFDQVGAALAQMTAQGVPTAQATTQLRSAMVELSKSGTTADKAFREAAKDTKYAGMSFKEAMAKGANLGEVFSIMQAYADATGMSMVDLWGSVEAGNAAMVIASDVEKVNSNLEQMGTDADVVGEAYGKMSDTFGTSMNRLKESAKNFMTTLFTGGDISQAFDDMLSALGDVGGRLITWMTNGLKSLGENLPGMMNSLLDFGASLLESLGKVNWIELGTTIVTGIIGAMGTLGTRLIELVGEAITAVANGDVKFSEIGDAIFGGVTSVITTAGDWLSTLFKTAVSAVTGGEIDFGGIGTSILGGVTSVLDGAGTFLSNIFKTGKDAVTNGSVINWNEIGTSVLNGLSSAVDMAGHFLEGAFSAGAALVKEINWNEIGTTIGNAVNGTVDTAGAFLSGCFEAAKKTIDAIEWDGIGKAVGDAVNGTIDTAGAFLSGCFEAAKKTIDAIEWDGIGKTIGGAVNGTVDTAGEFLSAGFTAAHATIKAIDWKGIGDTIGGIANEFTKASGEALAAPFKAAHSILSSINWAEVGSAIQSGIGDVWSGLTGFLGGLLGGVGDAASGIGSGIGDAAAGIGKAIGNLFSGDDAKQAAADMEQAMRDLESAITSGKTDIETAAKDVGKSIRESMESELKANDVAKIGLDAGKNLVNGVKSGVALTEGELKTRISELQSNAKSSFDANWHSTGTNIVRGIVSGVRGAANSLKNTMKQLAKEALQAAKDELGISSPSKVMRDQVGLWIPAGIAEGIENGSGLVSNAMNDLANETAMDPMTDMLVNQGRQFGGAQPADTGMTENSQGDVVQALITALEKVNIYLGADKVGRMTSRWVNQDIKAGDAAVLRGMGG